MNTKQITRWMPLALAWLTGVTMVTAQPTTLMTYQGRLTDRDGAVNGRHDFQFQLFDAERDGRAMGVALLRRDVVVSNGQFEVLLDFDPRYFLERTPWLEIGVQPAGAGGSYSILSPRQPCTAVPYALASGNLMGVLSSTGLQGVYNSAVELRHSANKLSGIFTGNGAGITNVNALTLDGLASSNFWRIGGNDSPGSGAQTLGTMDDHPLQFRVHGNRVLLLNDGAGTSPNLVGGHALNSIASNAVGSVIAGGGAPMELIPKVPPPGFIGIPHAQGVAADYAAISGGSDNRITTNGHYGLIAGGLSNVVDAAHAFAAGRQAHVNHRGSFVWADTQATPFESSADNQFAVRAGGGVRVETGGGGMTLDGLPVVVNGGAFRFETNATSPNLVGGHSGNAIGASNYGSTIAGGGGGSAGNSVEANYASIGGGAGNSIQSISHYSVIAGGRLNDIRPQADYASILGGYLNVIFTNANYASIGGGYGNQITNAAYAAAVSGGYQNAAIGSYAMLPGGWNNVAAAYSLAAGRRAKALHPGAFVWADSANADFASTASQQFLVRAAGGVGINTNSPKAALHVAGETMTQVLTITGGADLAEPFPVSDAESPSPGAVMVIDPEQPGHLKLSHTPYDKRVAGIISGANGVNPGLTLRQAGTFSEGRNVALNGRVYALADASNGAIAPGDLLTTSDKPGYAMKVTDHARAQGAVIGKAMSKLEEGQGMVLVLVNLQ